MLARSTAVVILVALLAPARSVHADIQIAISPATAVVAPGEVFDLELLVPESGDSFNGYGATVTFDPAVLAFVELIPRSLQEGEVMTDACGLRFHDFQAPGGGNLTIGHVLLCAGVSVTGPGTVYRLRFEASLTETTTAVAFDGVPQFYDGGILVGPVMSSDASVVITSGTGVDSVPAPPPQLLAFPNPFNPRIRLAYDLPQGAYVQLSIFSVSGRLVQTLIDGWQPSGRIEATWDGTDRSGSPLSSGVFHTRLTHGGTFRTAKITLLR